MIKVVGGEFWSTHLQPHSDTFNPQIKCIKFSLVHIKKNNIFSNQTYLISKVFQSNISQIHGESGWLMCLNLFLHL